MMDFAPCKTENLHTVPQLACVRYQDRAKKGNATVSSVVDHFLSGAASM